VNLRDRIYQRLSDIALHEFPRLVTSTRIGEGKLRIFIVDKSYIDVWFSERRKGSYSYHWERRTIDGTIYRHDNKPDKAARSVRTFPKHFHNGSEHVAPKESHISDDPEEALREFLSFCQNYLKLGLRRKKRK
jgi:hypothetical protein